MRVNDAVLDRTGERLAISTYPRRDGWAGYPSQIHVWSLSPDARSKDLLRRSVQMAGGRRVDSAGGLVPLSSRELRAAWQQPDVACVPREAVDRLRLWHLQQATRGDDFGRAFHARQIVRYLGLEIDAGGADATHYQERAMWRRRGAPPAAKIADDVLADYAAAIDRDPQDRTLRRERGEFYLEIGELRHGLTDLAIWLDVHAATADVWNPWIDLENVHRLAFLALILDDTAIYRAACRRALTLARQLSAAPPVERWNGVFHACWTAILDGRSGLDSRDWSALHDLVADAQAEGRTGDASLLKAAIAARGGDANTALLQLRDLDQRPFDRLFAALALVRLRRLEEASGLRLLARHDIETWCEHEQRHDERSVFGPGWPGWPAVAAAIEVDLDRALTAK